ncbi:Stp1/IreP family PP2C-type Ser/Thr phosphatase [Jeotgalibacillus haloalkalitolerans]|uniref:Stp1/IreP family PP2C-type Ser/Thr phosphatase n=1 Tax=Jeotgalibacillus haloalkalitolerans TaxID=3104292 RepID=A0ABU5KK29_9BACL|nr:Stp1/IreP family PP2C-type Ser/Thr phosphatase [Jeotgalibacillus sp. HH7-29]MDZ5711606.1 Stp1/IreP family PP2C-type Ser/Thr phosphatase [Jeotgalibacillus sp. HH7-29]
MEAVFKSDRGKIRKLNEDSGGIFKNHFAVLALVADGMGGHRAGDVASKMTVDLIESKWHELNSELRAGAAEDWLSQTIEEVNTELFQYAEKNPECNGMGTTLVAAICTEDFISIANIGDSRGYVINQSKVIQMTEDDSFVNALVQSGEISKEDAEHHPKKNLLLKALGTQGKADPSIKTIVPDHGTLILLCSDGLSNKVSEGEISALAENDLSLDQMADRLISLANDYGGEDNITLAAVRISLQDEGGESL